MSTPEEKLALAAERSRRYRQRKAATRAGEHEQLLALPLDERDDERDAPPPTPPTKKFTMVASVENAVAHMKWIQPSDGALVDMAKLYAVQIDQTLAADPTATGKAASLGQLLTRILHELGGTPTVRLQHELRSLRLASQPADPTPGDTDASNQVRAGRATSRGQATVTSIQRPPKRAAAR